MTKIKAYMGSGYDPADSAILIFAENAKQAKKIGFGRALGVDDWIDFKVKWLQKLPEHLSILNTGQLKVVEFPPKCPSCQMWGGELVKTGCEFCEDEDE